MEKTENKVSLIFCLRNVTVILPWSMKDVLKIRVNKIMGNKKNFKKILYKWRLKLLVLRNFIVLRLWLDQKLYKK